MAVSTGWTTTQSLVIGTGDVGNGSVWTRWKRVEGQVLFVTRFVVGSTTDMVGDHWFYVPANDVGANPLWATISGVVASRSAVVPAAAYDSSAGTWYAGIATLQPVANNEATVAGACDFTAYPVFSSGPMDEMVPFAWEAGDELIFGNAIEAFGN